MKPPRKYASATAFRVALESRLKKLANEEDLDLQRLRRQAAFDRLLCRVFTIPDTPWLLKGGYAMELRLKTARTTRDIDLAMRRLPLASVDWDANVPDVLESLREAGNLDLSDFFTFVVGNVSQDLDAAPYGGARFPVDARLAGRTFSKFHLDVSAGDVLREPYETLSGRDWLGFAGIASTTFPAVSTEEQFAEKLHAYTLPRESRENTRVKDLVDLILLIERTKLDAARLPIIVTGKSTPDEKVKLFRNLFRGREDVYALRWEGRTGKTGYSPACRKVWGNPLSKHPDKLKKYFPLTDQVIHDHLTGKITAGIYSLLADETCWFLAADFDKTTWQDDVQTFLHTCTEWEVPAVLERSRSGRGGHIWIFFKAPLPARLARKLGAAILTRTMEQRHQLGLDSYDRFFPSQDTMPKGGFGNLIALPLQHMPRGHGNSVFLDVNFNPYPDQWAVLSSVRRMALVEVENIVGDAERNGDIIGVRRSVTGDEQTEDPWTLPPSRKKKDEPISGPLPAKVRVIRGNLIFVEKEGLPSAMLNRLHRLAAFQNPEFYRAQAMRLSIFGKPRVIHCAEEFPRHVALPRGCFGEITALLESHKVAVELDDQRFIGQPIDLTFHGQLRPCFQPFHCALRNSGLLGQLALG
jgi:hypothetical protein